MGRLEFHTLPVPAFDEYTVRIAAGAVTFGVEYRHLDEATILAFYGPESRAKFDGKMPAGMTDVVEEDGLALHVFDTATGEELLRFDCFPEAAHWHLLCAPESRNIVIEHDVTVDGPLIEWALLQLRADLRGLLREAGAGSVADALDDELVAPALDTVAQTARYVVAAGHPVRVD
jgi:hypothetical protein